MHCENSKAGFQGAFTLMELVVVVVIIGIMTAIIIPEVKGTFEDALLRSTGRGLVNACSLASSRAVSLNQFCRVQLDTHAGRYFVERRISTGDGEKYIPLKDVSGGEGKLDASIAIEVQQPDKMPSEDNFNNPSSEPISPDAILFYPDGTAEAAKIQLRDRAGFQVILLVDPITSRVQISESNHE